MGFKYTVCYWDADKQDYLIAWEGENFFDAAEKMNTLKADGKTCISLIWRP